MVRRRLIEGHADEHRRRAAGRRRSWARGLLDCLMRPPEDAPTIYQQAINALGRGQVGPAPVICRTGRRLCRAILMFDRRAVYGGAAGIITKPQRIAFADFAKEPGAVFDEIARHQRAVLIEREGRLYRVEPAPEYDIGAGYDPEKALAALEAARKGNIFAGVDVEQLKADIKAERGQDSIGRPGDPCST